MVPGQSVVLLIERFPDRYEDKTLPRFYTVTVEFDDMYEKHHELVYVLDFDAYFGYGKVATKGLDDIAKSLDGIYKKLDRISGTSGLKVQAYDARYEEELSLHRFTRGASISGLSPSA